MRDFVSVNQFVQHLSQEKDIYTFTSSCCRVTFWVFQLELDSCYEKTMLTTHVYSVCVDIRVGEIGRN